MPNWCNTEYIATGPKQDLRDLHDKIKELETMEKSLVDNGFGNTWLGNLVTILGGDWEKVYCRGEWTYAEWDDDNLRISTWTAWVEMKEVRQLIEQYYDNRIKIFFISEESGCGYYYTNDTEGKYFPYRFEIVSDEGETHSFKTEEEARKYIESLIGRTLADDEDMDDALNECQGEDEWISYHEYELTD